MSKEEELIWSGEKIDWLEYATYLGSITSNDSGCGEL